MTEQNGAPNTEHPAIRTSRRSLLGGAAGLAGAALATGAWRPLPETSVAVAAITQGRFAGSAFALELADVVVARVKGALGGNVFADVVVEPASTDFLFQHKHIGIAKYEDFTVRAGLDGNASLYEWINATWTAQPGQPTAKNGALLSADAQLNITTRREFFNALVTEVMIPACDASSKDLNFITLTFAPERTQTMKGAGTLPGGTVTQKTWLSANFRLTILGLDTRGVSKVDAFTVRQVLSSDTQRQPLRLEFPNLRITLADSTRATWEKWATDFILNNPNRLNPIEKTLRLEFLSLDLKTVLGYVDAFGVGIFEFATELEDSLAPLVGAPKSVADLYCERMELHTGAPPFPIVDPGQTV